MYRTLIRKEAPDAVTFGTQKVGLTQVNRDKGRNDVYIGSCMEYFGMSDNLCEQIYAEE